MKKYLIIFLTVMLLFTSLSTSVMAAFEAGTNPAGTESKLTAAEKIGSKGAKIVSAILWCGYAVALGMVVFIGIKYILGSAEAKSNMKNAIVSWFIGAGLVFMCTTIVGWVLNIISASDNLAEDIINAGQVTPTTSSTSTSTPSSTTSSTSTSTPSSTTSSSTTSTIMPSAGRNNEVEK